MISKLTIERFGPYVVGSIAAFIWWFNDLSIPAAFAKELLSAVISAASVCAGFLTTALSILMTLGSSAIGRQVERRNKTSLLFGYLRNAIYSCLLLAAACVASYFWIEEKTGIPTLASTVLIGVSLFSIASIVRIIEILIRIFQAMSSSSNGAG